MTENDTLSFGMSWRINRLVIDPWVVAPVL